MYSTNDVTIIIPVYCTTDESVKWFQECLSSALRQGCPVQVVSDASPKPVNHIIESMWQERISYWRMPEHIGVSSARNLAVMHTKTKLFLPLDCDDTIRDGAITELVEHYDETPLYPDVRKFGDEEDEHYQLLNFACQHLYEKVGLASVCVLQSKEQWKKVGGWSEHIDFYEDGEYNARLMLTFCGERYPHPLINYRIHSGQRTKINQHRSRQQALTILQLIKEYPSMCCGKNRKNSASSMQQGSNLIRSGLEMEAPNLPGTQGDRVLAQYVGGQGKGKHYYRGPNTKYAYKVKYGQYVYVDPLDAKEEGNPISRSLFIRVSRAVEESIAPETLPKAPEKVERTPRKKVKKAPVLFKEKEVSKPLPDINNLRWQKEIRHMEFSPEQAKTLIAIEEGGKGRTKVLEHLRKYA